MAEPALQLLGHGVDVAEAPLQRMTLEDRGGAGRVIGEVDGLARLVNGVGRSAAHGDAVIERESGTGADLLPDRGQLLQEKGAGRADADLDLGEAGLHDRAVANRAPGAA